MADLTLVSLSPNEALVGSTTPVTVTITGTGFTEDTILLWNGAEDVFRFISETEGETIVDMALVTIASTATVALSDGIVTTDELTFTFIEEGGSTEPPPDENPASPNTDAIPAEYMPPIPPDVYRQVKEE